MSLDKIPYRIILLLLSVGLIACSSNKSSKLASHQQKNFKKTARKHDARKLTVAKRGEKFEWIDVFVSEQKQNEMKCPSKVKKKENEYGKVNYPKDKIEEAAETEQALIVRKAEVIEFDIVHVEERKLDIPAFKQFKNNMTDFTRDGEQQFREIILQIREYLGDNTNGDGVTLYIKGSASQIPTSFDPTKPNNNINPDGSSIHGETSVENNRLLALARATELANKIQAIFSDIKIVTPTLNEIEIGKTQWTTQVQRDLDKAYLSGDKGKMMEIFAPFQKEQFVQVESHETFVKTVQPNAIKMYTVSFVPRIEVDGNEVEGSLVVSESTFWKVGANRKFEDVKARDKFLKEMGLDLTKIEIDGEERWVLVGSKEEKEGLKGDNDYDKIYNMHQQNMVNEKDRDVLERIITHKYLNENRYKYILKDNTFSNSDF